MFIFDDLERRRGEVERHRENSARLAQAFAKYETDGQGTIEFEDQVNFGLTFVQEPFLTHASQVDLDELGDLLNLEPGALPPIPLVVGAVTEWDRDDRDFYVGAWVAVRVHFPSGDAIPADVPVHINHYFSFTGIAMKDVPVDIGD